MPAVLWQQRYEWFYDIAIAGAQPEDVYAIFRAARFGKPAHSDTAVDAIFEMLFARANRMDAVFPRLEHPVLAGFDYPRLEYCSAVFSLRRELVGPPMEILFHAIETIPVIPEQMLGTAPALFPPQPPNVFVTVNWGNRLQRSVEFRPWHEVTDLLAAVKLERLGELPLDACGGLEMERTGVAGRTRSVLHLRDEVRDAGTAKVFVSGVGPVEN